MMHKIRSNRPIKFLVCGGFSAIAELGSFILLRQSGISTFWAALISFTVGLIMSYTLSSRVVFAALEKRHKKEASRQFVFFLALAGCNAIVSSSAVNLLQHPFGDAIRAKLVMMIAVGVWNYFIIKHYIFPDHK